MFDDFKKYYCEIDFFVGGTQVNVPAFKSLFPIIVFDVTGTSYDRQSYNYTILLLESAELRHNLWQLIA